MRNYTSPVFGPTRDANEAEAESIAQLVREVPVAVFGALNLVLNERGFCILMKELGEAVH